MPGTLFVVATPIGNLEDITVRALRILREVSIIAAEDTRRTAHLLARYAIATPTTSLHAHNEAGKSGSLVARLQGGENVALVSDAGTPTISDPGGLLIRSSIDAGIRVEPVPGPSAVLTALAASGLPTHSFSFMGFAPTRSKDRKEWLTKIDELRGTIVFFESPHRIQSTLRDIERRVGDCQAVVCRELTKIHEEFVRGSISELVHRELNGRGEFTVVLNIGLSPEIQSASESRLQDIATEFGVMTKINGLTRRMAIASIARRHSLAPNRVYEILEEAKKLV
jgi:16S rRNA (cytidine1402-2'-O)-methyltransferase